MNDCKHEHQFPMPDSLATVCEQCGQVFIQGEPWDYRSGNITEWLDDLCEAKEKHEQHPREVAGENDAGGI